jgi:hypothetical protein
MKNPVQIAVPAPCHENWQQMAPADKGRFCASCQKNVTDFTDASDREIAAAFAGNSNLCGRFLATQLNRDLVVPKEKSTLWIAASAAVVSFLSLGSNEAAAQEKTPTEQGEIRHIVGKPAPRQNKTVTGTVNDESGFPIPGVDISIKNRDEKVQTDLDGKFTIPIREGDILQARYVGMVTEEITIDGKANYNVTLKDDVKTLSHCVVVGMPYYKKPTFFGRIFRSIGNLFR